MVRNIRRAVPQGRGGSAPANQSAAGEEDPGSSLELTAPGVPGAAAQGQAEVDLGNAELVQLQLRVIALENLVMALLANAPRETAELARAIAANISPRPGRTPHHLTLRGAGQMIHLLKRAQVSKDSDFGADG
jgi:hypothetical protein